jgi:hexosaminidase
MSADKVYSQLDIRDLIVYASLRGVRLIPETDTPGHARSFGLAPEYSGIVACADVLDYTQACMEPPCGQLNPANDTMYKVDRKMC